MTKARKGIADVNACVHWWSIDLAAGPKSWGICKHCHDRRQFDNVVSVPWGLIGNSGLVREFGER
jgi:hypothetical protein